MTDSEGRQSGSSAGPGVDLPEFKHRLRIPAHDNTLERAVLFHRARAREARGELDGAEAAYRNFVQIAPNEGVGYARLAGTHVKRGATHAAADVYVTLSELLAAQQRWGRAATAYETAAELAPEDAGILGALRDVYIKLGMSREAAKVQARLDAIVQASPNNGVAEVLLPDIPPSKTGREVPPLPERPSEPTPPSRNGPGSPATVLPETTPPRVGPVVPGVIPAGKPPVSDISVDRRKPHPVRARSKSLGQVLLDEKIVTREQLEHAIQMQQRSGGHLGRILVDLGTITDQQLAHALSLQWGMSVVDLSAVLVDPDAVRLIPLHLAQRHKVLAIEKRRNRLQLVIADPLNVMGLDDVRLVTGLDIEPMIAPEEEITAAIARYYTSTIDLDEAVRQAAGLDLDVTTEERGEEVSLDRLRTMVEEAPIVRLVSLIINQAIAEGASDIHIEPHRRHVQVRYRVDGLLRDVMAPPKALQAGMVSRIKIMASLDIAERRVPQDGRIHVTADEREFDLRVSTLPTVFGEKVVMRILDQTSMRLGLNKLGYTPATLETWQQLISKPYGMILVSGPTGSGKTTTLYATLHRLNTLDKNILTVEDPVEYQLARVNQVQVNPKAGVVFSSTLRSFLRQDPDIIMVGEIRDRETAEIAIQASLTGHLVLSTIHTNDAPSATTRLVDMGVEPFLISSSVITILAQRLVRTICAHCREAYRPPIEALHRLGLTVREGEEVVFYRGRGCDRCKNSGYRGRTGVFELMVMTDPVRELVLRGASAVEIRTQAINEGMRTLRDDGVLKVLEGVTTVDELLRVVFVEA